MTEDNFLRTLPLADRLCVAAVDLAVTGAPRALVEAVWEASEVVKPELLHGLSRSSYSDGLATGRTRGELSGRTVLPHPY